jgi:PTH2 family peptidyl-tRNA hydrolase
MARLKQVILIRRDLKMRRGKEIAQGSHASMDFLVERILAAVKEGASKQVPITLSETELRWLSEGMAKVCLQVGSEAELLEMHEKASNAGLVSHLIQDSGRTEFGGVATYTALAIGPAEAEAMDAITGSLALY